MVQDHEAVSPVMESPEGGQLCVILAFEVLLSLNKSFHLFMSLGGMVGHTACMRATSCALKAALKLVTTVCTSD